MSLQSGDIYRHIESGRHVMLQEIEKTSFSNNGWYVLWFDTGQTGLLYSLDLLTVWEYVA